MKLSLKATEELGSVPWAPVELVTSKPALTDEGVQSMMEIFNKSAANLATPGISGSRVLKAEIGQLASNPWLPGEAMSMVNAIQRADWLPATAWKEAETPTSTLNAARREAERIIAEARKQAEEVLIETRHQADTIILNSHREGWLAAEVETENLMSTARSLVEQVNAWREEMLAKSEEDVLDLVRAIAQRMFGEGIVLSPDSLQEAFNQALKDARALGDLRFYVHPQDASSLDPYWRDFQVAIGGHQIKIIPSEAIRRGGCFIDGDLGSVDARVETQLKSIMEVLGGNSPEKDGPA
jgi:flagellar biosynthesis/type III secretory pathway protein FliH